MIKKLSCGKKISIDKQDYEYLIGFFPYWRVAGNRVMLTRYIHTNFGAVRQDVYLARAITRPPKHLLVDHKDGNPLNNKRSNLRWATHSQNNVNRKKTLGKKTSKYFGVSLCRREKDSKKPWRIFLRCKNGKRIIGSFSSERGAARAWDKISRQEWGDFAPQNFKK